MSLILHITPHLGGGVGKVLSGLVGQSVKSNSEFKHIIVSMEENKKSYFKNKILKIGELIENPDKLELDRLIRLSDIIQLEWWNHPLAIKYLCSHIFKQPIRLITWCHNNGLFPDIIKENGKLHPIIPKNLILASKFFIFTNPCSAEYKNMKNADMKNADMKNANIKDRLGIVYSSGGFEDFPNSYITKTETQISEIISLGYFGYMGFTKLHPSFVEFIHQANKSKELTKVKMIGECSYEIMERLNQQCKEMGEYGILHFTGYLPEDKLIYELNSINVLAYLLNPKHYGTTENSLLEAMSMGIVPIVLNNPCETHLVDNEKTGFVVTSPKEFGEIVAYLSENSDERKRIGKNAAKIVRRKFSAENTMHEIEKFYKKAMNEEKTIINFNDVFKETIIHHIH